MRVLPLQKDKKKTVGQGAQKKGSVVQIKKEWIQTYTRLHADVWPDVLRVLRKGNIENYSIFLKQINDSGFFLFSYFEYVGDDYEGDMARIASAPITQKWWAECKPCLIPLDGISMDQCWAPMEQVFDLT